ncbi:MAG: DUF1015 domain-containing protein [Oscillospiraceae bacterium]|nr:DUF1015 domain-containing protein [Oscillospiraceae bacterium]
MTAFSKTNILLPKLDAAGMAKWSVVACDQYTSEPDYWTKTAEIVDGAPSALKLILPEVYLEEPDCDKRISVINSTMTEYLESGLFEEFKNCLVLTKRTQADGRLRAGLVGAVDLEMYDYNKGSKSQVRATEATVKSRIPPRVKIRMNAPLELPHIMILIDDPKCTVIEPLLEKELKPVYDFELMQNGGHLSGAIVDGDDADGVLDALDKLAEEELKIRHWSGLEKEGVLLYAMGDGNHSLATAKECYEQKKAAGSPDAELARFALVEIVNLHSPALEFEAIHRVISDVNAYDFVRTMEEVLGLSDSAEQEFQMVGLGGKVKKFGITKPTSNLTVGSLQKFLDEYLAKNGGKIDYIHGEDVVRKICADGSTIGFLLPAMKKSELFPTVIKDGALPRKTFSMGHAHDKRFYCEARRITRL